MISGSALNTTSLNGDVTELTIAQVCNLARLRVQADAHVEISEHVRLERIDKNTLDVAKAWRKKYLTPKMQNREPGWKWEDEYYKRVRRGRNRMKASKVKVKVTPVARAKTGLVYTVNVARMDQYLAQTREAFKERVKLTHQARGEFAGALAGTVSKPRIRK